MQLRNSWLLRLCMLADEALHRVPSAAGGLLAMMPANLMPFVHRVITREESSQGQHSQSLALEWEWLVSTEKTPGRQRLAGGRP